MKEHQSRIFEVNILTQLKGFEEATVQKIVFHNNNWRASKGLSLEHFILVDWNFPWM